MTSTGLRVADVSCLVCTTPRSGSWLMSSAMQQTGRLGIPEEYFRGDALAMWSAEWGLGPRAPFRRYINHAVDYGTTDNGVFAAKLHWYQMLWFINRIQRAEGRRYADLPAEAALAAVLPEPRFVYLHRRDSARQALSFYRAARSGVWFHLEENNAPELEQHLAINRKPMDDEEWQYVKHLENIVISNNEDWIGFFDTNGIEPLEIAYEDFTADYAGTLGRLVEYVGAGRPEDVAGLQPQLVRQSDELTEIWVEEYEARRDSLTPKPVPKEVRLPAVRRV